MRSMQSYLQHSQDFCHGPGITTASPFATTDEGTKGLWNSALRVVLKKKKKKKRKIIEVTSRVVNMIFSTEEK